MVACPMAAPERAINRKIQIVGMAPVRNEKVVNTTLRFADEFARHKILDIMGDMYLLGRPLRGKVIAKMTGHSDNIALLREIKKHTQL